MSINNRPTEGNKGGTFPYNKSVLKGLQKIADNTGGIGNLSAAMAALTSAVIDHQEFEIKLVRDPNNSDAIYQQIREYDETTATWSTFYTDVTGATVVPSVEGDLEYMDPDAVLNLMLTELQAINANTDGLEALVTSTNALLTTIDTDTSNLDVALSTRATEATLLLVKAVLDALDLKAGTLTDGVGTDNTAHGANQKGQRALGTDGANDQQIKVDSDGNVSVNVLTSTLPTGASLEATQLLVKGVLDTIDAVLDNIKLDTANLNLGTSGDTTSVPSSATVVTLKAANTSRKSLKIVNDGTKILYVREGAGATTSLYTWKLEQDEMAIIDDYNGVVTGIWDVANGSAKVTETT
jgi:hypothetical protein